MPVSYSATRCVGVSTKPDQPQFQAFSDPSCDDDGGVREACPEVDCPSIVDAGAVDVPFLKTCHVITEDLHSPPCGNPARPTEAVCLAENSDPPISSPVGYASYLVSMTSIGVIDNSSSAITISAEGGVDGGVPVPVSGYVGITGEPCPGSECDVGLYALASGGDFRLTFAVADVPGAVDVSRLTATARSAPGAVSLDASGNGHMAGTDALGGVRAHVKPDIIGFSEGAVAFLVRPSDDVDVNVDYATRSFRVRGSLDIAGQLLPPRPQLHASFVVRGALVSQPPVARAGPDSVAECGGVSNVILDGSATTDGDGDIIGNTWFAGLTLAPENAIATGLTTTVTQAIGGADYTLFVSDSRNNLSSDAVHVDVVDTTAPTVSDFMNNGPACLSPPNHKFVVLRVGAELTAVVEDACDSSPQLVIASGSSNQAGDSTGDGNTLSDIRIFPDRVCLRAERKGDASEDRVYTLHLVARDSSGNESDPVVEIRVAHDQSDGDCPHLDATEFVDEDDDPRCALGAPAVAPATSSLTSAAEGCSASGGSHVCGALALALLFLRRTRTRWRLGGAAVLLIGTACEAPSTEPLGSCLVDVWLTSGEPCSCEAADGEPECAATDCSYQGYRWFLEEGTLRFGFIMSSETSGTFSTTAAPAAQEWSLSGDDLTLRTPGTSSDPVTQPVSRCDSLLVWGSSLRFRAPAGAADSFASAHSERGWTEQPYVGR